MAICAGGAAGGLACAAQICVNAKNKIKRAIRFIQFSMGNGADCISRGREAKSLFVRAAEAARRKFLTRIFRQPIDTPHASCMIMQRDA
jgi:hypothetical protein